MKNEGLPMLIQSLQNVTLILNSFNLTRFIRI